MAPTVKHDTKPRDAEAKAATSSEIIRLSAGFRQSFRLRGGGGRAAGRPQLAAAAAARSLCRAALGHLLHHRARGEPPHLDLPHPALGGAPALCAHRQWPDPQRAVQRGRRDADAAALVAVSDPARSRPISSKASSPLVGNGDVATQVGMAVHIYAANRSMTEPLLLQCRRRNADCAATRPRRFCHRARHASRRVVARSSSFRAGCASASSCRTVRRAAISARITARCCACRNSARSAPTGSPIRATSWRRSRPTRTWRRRSAWSPNSRAICGRRR